MFVYIQLNSSSPNGAFTQELIEENHKECAQLSTQHIDEDMSNHAMLISKTLDV